MMMMIIIITFIYFFSPLISADPIELPEILLREQTPINQLIIQLNTSINVSSPSYRFVSNNQREIQRYFTLNSSTGELYLSKNLNRQMICTHRHVSCRFILKIFELSAEKLFHLPLIIEEINHIRPKFLYNSSRIQFHLSENSPIYQSKLFIQQIYQPDQKNLKYELKHHDEHFPFILEINPDLNHRLALVLIQTLDRETQDTYHCTIHISDYDEQLHVEILIDDVNDQSPIFDKEKYSVELSENTPVNTTIVHVHASDGDIGLNGDIVYEFTDASKQFNQIFSLDHQTGIIRLNSPLDYEQRSSYLFYLQARDCGKEIRSTQTLINITLIDENDNSPRITFRFLSELIYHPSKHLLQISENYPTDKFFSQILVTDADHAIDNGRVRLWMETSDRNFHLYQIDSSTYILNRSQPFDYESEQKYQLKFYAEDFHPRNPLQTEQILTIEIVDENDNFPQFFQAFYRLSLRENNQVNAILTKIEAFDLDQGENGRITYEILTNDTIFPWAIDSNTGILCALTSFDRENRSSYQFEILARDHGTPQSHSARIPIRIDIDDANDNPPRFEYNQYEYSIEENYPRGRIFARLRALDRDLHSKLIYRIDGEKIVQINSKGELSFRQTLDREQRNVYHFHVMVSDGVHQTSTPVVIRIIDINDCPPQWIHPAVNLTKIFLNRDSISLGTMILRLEAIDRDDIGNGNGFIRFTLDDDHQFLIIANHSELRINSIPPPKLGRYLVKIRAQDQGKSIRYSSMIMIDLFIGNNQTNAETYSRINSMSTVKRVIFLGIFFLSIAFIFIFIISMISMIVCRYRKRKYLKYLKCNQQQKKIEEMIDSNSDSSNISFKDNHHLSIYHQGMIKPTPTSDYYSNSSKHEEDADEWTDEQRSGVDNSTEWSIEKILYPDWLYRDSSTRKQWNTTTFFDCNSSPAFSNTRSPSIYGKRSISSNSHQPSPKQVRFGCDEQIYSYRHLTTTIQRLQTSSSSPPGTTTTTITNSIPHNTFL